MKEYKSLISELDLESLEILSEELADFNEDHMNNIRNKFVDKRRSTKKTCRKVRKKYAFSFVALAASICIIFTGTVNFNPVFAARLLDMPIIGSITEWVSLDKIELHDKYREIEVVVPSIKGLQDGNVQAKINEILESRSMRIYDQAVEASNLIELDAKKNGFITSIPEDVTQTFELLRKDIDILSFKVVTTKIKASGSESAFFYNIDLNTSRLIKLEDLFEDGYDYRAVINLEIVRQMNKGNEDENLSYFVDEFESINDHNGFYFNEENKLVIVFNEYEIAAGYMGMPEFVLDTNLFDHKAIKAEYFK